MTTEFVIPLSSWARGGVVGLFSFTAYTRCFPEKLATCAVTAISPVIRGRVLAEADYIG